MSNATAKKKELLTTESTSSKKNTSERVKDTHTEELIIGICAQIGAKKNEVIDKLKAYLKEFDYKVEVIKLSKTISDNIFETENQPYKTAKFCEYNQKIKTGNDLREKHGNDYLANVAITKIAKQKKDEFGVKTQKDFSNIKSQRICYIIDSIKHTDELLTFRNVYREIFYLIGIFTPKDERINFLAGTELSQKEAEELVEIDEYQEDLSGQQVRKVFIDSDFFVRVNGNENDKLERNIEKYINLIFEYGMETPTIEERAMYEAKSASVNSSCLSRQVGASIVSSNGELISIGWNDVPKAGGNLYSGEDKVDHRCFNSKKCFNDEEKSKLRKLILNKFKEGVKDKIENGGLFSKEIKEKLIDGLEEKINFEINKNTSNLLESILESSSIKNLIEFSRSVHAEMHAIINAGHLDGNKIKGGILFCTTYPCHNCARHIVASGINKVYYIEPYIKSKAPLLHEDSITEKEGEVQM
ncbi:anti-phage dCTP deaminase [Flagellimonas amoyensis]|uniref:anti-phage dCTP deaminase n=1 Tax=Flagellimonas amoyensis TaxID=2169401 RepID=UPI00131EEEE8|nr:anti-phage dCTP deaminase [Allomuricauda amoyensis]